MFNASASDYPLTVDNCGVKETFAHPPARVVTVGQHETELLLALGLADKIAATSVWFGALPADLQGRAASLNGWPITPGL